MELQLNTSLPSTDAPEFIEQLQQAISAQLSEIENALITDLSHISHFANYQGGMAIEGIEDLGDNQFLMHYGFDWQINNACADQLDEGRSQEKVRFRFQAPGLVVFRILKFD